MLGLYGKWEDDDQEPTDLDVCGGHFGVTPTTMTPDNPSGTSTSIYHYHIQDQMILMNYGNMVIYIHSHLTGQTQV